MNLTDITSGWMGLLSFTLSVNGTPFPLDDDWVVELVLHNYLNSLIVPGGVVTVLNQTTYPGQVTYQPVAEDFVWISGGQVKQPYQIHWKVTDADARPVSFPNGAADEIAVYRL